MPTLPYEKIIQTAMRHGADYAEVFSERTRKVAIVCDNKRLEQVASFSDEGLGIRILVDGKTVYGSTNDLTLKSLMGLAREVGKAARKKGVKTEASILREKSSRSVTMVQKHPFGISLDEKCMAITGANDLAWRSGKAVRQVRIIYRDTVRRIEIASSDGFLASDEQVDTVFSALVVAGNEHCIQTGTETIAGAVGFEIFDDMPPECVAQEAANRAIKLLDARGAPAGTMPVVISSEAGGTMIHEAVGHGLEGDAACEGMSVYSGRIGEKVASDIVSVADDATLAGKRGSITFDDEGTPAARTTLIENGVLKTYMSNRASLNRHGLALTGNARRQSYEHPPIVRMTNTFILPGKDDPASILRDTNSGLFVRKMGGGQVNTVNGDFVFDVQEGYLIENGKIAELVRGATLIGNGPLILKSIDKVGSDLGFSVGTCGKEGQEVPVSCGQPTIRIPEMVVGGTEKK